jgi:hypothetical protein
MCLCSELQQWLCRRRWVLKYKTNKQAAIYGESRDARRALWQRLLLRCTHTQCSQSFVLVIVVDQKAVDQIFILVYTRTRLWEQEQKRRERQFVRIANGISCLMCVLNSHFLATCHMIVYLRLQSSILNPLKTTKAQCH